MNNKINKTINYSLIVLALISVVLGIVGWYAYYLQIGKEIDICAALYNGLQLFTLNSNFESIHLPVTLNIARFTAPASLAGAIISTLLMLTRNNYSSLRIKFTFREHVIICGYTKRARILIEDLISSYKNLQIVVIDDQTDRIEEIQSRNLIFLEGNPASEKILNKAGIRNAAKVLLLDEDSKDIITLNQLKKMKFPGKVILHLTNLNSTTLYKEMSGQLGLADLHVISDTTLLAAKIIDKYSPDQFLKIKSTDDPPVHILLCGGDPFIVDLLREIGIMYHFANLKKTKVTIAVPDITDFRKSLISFQLHNLDKVIDYNIIDLKDLSNPNLNLTELKNTSLSMICFKDFACSIEFGRRLRQIFISQNGCIDTPQILLIESFEENQPNVDDALIKKMQTLNLSFCKSLKHFSAETVINNKEEYDIIAKNIHNSFLNNTKSDEVWGNLSDAEKDWNRLPARHFHIKLRVIGAKIVKENEPGEEFDIKSVSEEHRTLLARMEKNRWNAEKWLTGFVPGKYVNDDKLEKLLKREYKIHPALKSWDEITDEEREKDKYAFNNIREILKYAGKKIVADT